MKNILILLVLMGTVSSAAETASPAGDEPNALSAAQLRQRCVDVMNADPHFAASIVATVDRQIDDKTVAAHIDADYHIRKNQRHVIYAYAALWVIAAAFVWFMHRRQAALTAEIAALRRDLDRPPHSLIGSAAYPGGAGVSEAAGKEAT